MSLPALINYFADFEQIKKLLLEKLRNLTGRYATPEVTLHFYYHHVTYRTPCHASGHLVIYRECYGGVFCLTLLPASFKAYLGAGNSTSRLAGLHNDLRNIAPDRLFV